jgi:DNA-directed RNA polymerase specialized sigma24 family protein
LEAQSSVELWQILVTITKRKLINLREEQHTQKRGGGDVRGDSIWAQTSEENVFHQQADRRQNVTPDAHVELMETTDLLFQRLDNDTEREVARLMLEGYRINDIAEKMNCVRRTIERKVERIRKKWNEVLSDD